MFDPRRHARARLRADDQSSYNRLHAGGAYGRKLRGCRPFARAFSRRAEPADGRNRQWEIHRGGCAGAAAGRAGLGGDDPVGRGAGASRRYFRRTGQYKTSRIARSGRIRDRGWRAAHRARSIGGRKIARVCRQPAGDRGAAQRSGTSPWRYSRTARSAASV